MLAGDLGQHRFEIRQKQRRVFAHREVAEVPHDRDLGAGHRARDRQRVLRRAGIIVLAGQQVERAGRRVDAVELRSRTSPSMP